LTQEKIVASCSKRFVVIVDYRKKSEKLGQSWKKGIPVEVIPMAYIPVTKKIEKLGGKATLRMAVAKAGSWNSYLTYKPDEQFNLVFIVMYGTGPVVTDNGGFILDVDFGTIEDPAAINNQLRGLVGVIETGLFIGMAERVYIGNADGSVSLENRS